MNRRGFLSMIGLAPVAAVAATQFLIDQATRSWQTIQGMSGRAAVLVDELHEWRPFTMRASDLQLIAERRFSLQEIVQIYSVHLDEIEGAQ
jgi:hypothetical protein